MKRGNFTCFIGFVSVILSFFSCDPPETLNVSEMRDELTMLLGNNTTDTIVIIFENEKEQRENTRQEGGEVSPLPYFQRRDAKTQSFFLLFYEHRYSGSHRCKSRAQASISL